MKLRGSRLTEKLNRMAKSGGAFNSYCKKQKEEGATVAKISRDEENSLVSAMKKVDALKS